jgi:hypothetical protein
VSPRGTHTYSVFVATRLTAGSGIWLRNVSAVRQRDNLTRSLAAPRCRETSCRPYRRHRLRSLPLTQPWRWTLRASTRQLQLTRCFPHFKLAASAMPPLQPRPVPKSSSAVCASRMCCLWVPRSHVQERASRPCMVLSPCVFMSTCQWDRGCTVVHRAALVHSYVNKHTYHRTPRLP